MQTVIRLDPRTGQARAFQECTPQEMDAARLEQHIALIASGRLARPMVGTVRMDEFVPDTGRKKGRSRA
jgi:hypothetical protein